jgi:hypothetical protein
LPTPFRVQWRGGSAFPLSPSVHFVAVAALAPLPQAFGVVAGNLRQKMIEPRGAIGGVIFGGGAFLVLGGNARRDLGFHWRRR